MAITLDTVTLPDLVFSGPPAVAAVVDESIANTPVIFEQEKPSGGAINPPTAPVT